MMNKATDYPFTFGVAIAHLERGFNATYLGTCKPDFYTVEEANDTWHLFQTESGCDRIVNDSQLFQVANAYAS